MKNREIDINCDVGEGLGNEAKLFPYISSCNLACGGHAGDKKIIAEVIALAHMHQVRVGAHPSYPDKANFGRKSMEMSPVDFENSIISQIKLVEENLLEQKGSLSHIKAHGALYNDLAKDRQLAIQYLKILQPYKTRLALFLPFGSVLAEEADKSGWRCKYEAFGDRNYNDDLSLVSRTSGKALIIAPENVLEHLLLMITKSTVKTVSGNLVPIKADTYCIHGDTSSAYEILTYLSVQFPKHNIHLKK
ncbi:5-oxoprolinase subunit PxpA [Muriicola soli]|uniref:5-oxoprolinase subunit PxpA n=1 Tax=Muriicola soli TaxID=2507538 RepID=A0A411E8N1_9FLAO|nr:5-oxoprolinase subunit PxpA [Muriicola soli]QBA64076.1 5-oxoprolinase subunit PxpA [Muriicola soli]